MRLDQYLVKNGFVESRTKAQQLIKEGHVLVHDKVQKKASFKVDDDKVVVEDVESYVSRAALKLKGFIPHLPFSLEGKNVLDIGSSTGGFTEICLLEGATHVTALDVGTEQLHHSLRSDARVTSLEKTDIRNYENRDGFEVITSDVSFISLLNILESVDRLAKRWIILLFKPQFEVGREAKRDSNGVVLDKKAIAKAMLHFEDACHVRGWKLHVKEHAMITGKEGNAEECYCFEKC